jgi:hypothetical protein
MRAKEYMFVLITSICFILALISFQNACSVCKHVSEPQTEIDPFLSVTEAIEKFDTLTQGLQERIDRLDAITQEYERITQEHYSMSAQLRDFGEIMDEIGAREQKKYMEGRK